MTEQYLYVVNHGLKKLFPPFYHYKAKQKNWHSSRVSIALQHSS